MSQLRGRLRPAIDEKSSNQVPSIDPGSPNNGAKIGQFKKQPMRRISRTSPVGKMVCRNSVGAPTSQSPEATDSSRLKSTSASDLRLLPKDSLVRSKSVSQEDVRRKSYCDAKSKVKEYIENVKSLPRKRSVVGDPSALSRKTKSLSNLNRECSPEPKSNLSTMRHFISHTHLDDITITLFRKDRKSSFSKSTEKLSRLISNSSDDESDDKNEIALKVEELLEVAMEERQAKLQTKEVLSELQASYDELLCKYAEAENTIDKLRFRQDPSGGIPAGSDSYHDALRQLNDLEEKLYGVELLLHHDEEDLEQIRIEAFKAIHPTFEKVKQSILTNEPSGVDLKKQGEIYERLKTVTDKLIILKEGRSSAHVEIPELTVDEPDKKGGVLHEPVTEEQASSELNPIKKVTEWQEQNFKTPYPSFEGTTREVVTDIDSGYPGSEKSGLERLNTRRMASLPFSVNEDHGKDHVITEENEYERYLEEDQSKLNVEESNRSSQSDRFSYSKPSYLAEAIDKEIAELRNVFEDHKEEMTWLFQCQTLNPPLSQRPASNCPESHWQASNQPASHRPAKDQPASNRSSSHRPAGTPPIESESGPSSLEQPRRRKRRPKIPLMKSESIGRTVKTNEGEVYIPSLNLEDLWTDCSSSDKVDREKNVEYKFPEQKSRRQHKKTFRKKDIRKLLSSLEKTNEMALKLKERSVEMIETLTPRLVPSANQFSIEAASQEISKINIECNT